METPEAERDRLREAARAVVAQLPPLTDAQRAELQLAWRQPGPGLPPSVRQAAQRAADAAPPASPRLKAELRALLMPVQRSAVVPRGRGRVGHRPIPPQGCRGVVSDASDTEARSGTLPPGEMRNDDAVCRHYDAVLEYEAPVYGDDELAERLTELGRQGYRVVALHPALGKRQGGAWRVVVERLRPEQLPPGQTRGQERAEAAPIPPLRPGRRQARDT